MRANTFLWIGVAILAAWAAWSLLKFLLSYALPPEVTGRALLKKLAKQRGVDISRIPDAAIDEIVARHIRQARFFASMSNSVELSNWRANLVRSLRDEALVLQEAFSPRGPLTVSHPTRETLVKYGVVRD